MDINVVDYFIEFKSKFLVNCALCFFYKDKDLDLVEEFLKRYIDTYNAFYYYHELKTLNKTEVFDIVTLQKEFAGLEVEIKDQYAVNELIDSNEDYKYHLELISKAREVSYFISRMDHLEISTKDVIESKIVKFVNDNNVMLNYLGENMAKLVTLYKNYFTKTNIFFKNNDEFYHLGYRKVSEENDLIYVFLEQQIKILEINYKRSLVERIFNDENLDEEKTIILIQKLSKDILRKYLNNEHIENYLIKISDKLFERNKFRLEKLLANPLIKRYIILLMDFNTYTSRKKALIDEEYNLACWQNFLHINDVNTKLATIDGEGAFSYIIVSDYKMSDKEDILKYQCSNAKELIINKEV